MIATRALLAAGRYQRAREELELILKFQDRKTGMIWHELSQSAGTLEWLEYPYMFGHVDLSYDFLDLNSGSVTGGSQNGIMVGLTWIPTDHVRFLLNYARLAYDDARIPAAGCDRSYNFDVIGARAQIDW